MAGAKPAKKLICRKPYVRIPGKQKCTKNPKIVKIVQCRRDKVALVMREYVANFLRGETEKLFIIVNRQSPSH